jgi:hypothetical protein
MVWNIVYVFFSVFRYGGYWALQVHHIYNPLHTGL